jgi:hypothetical protein
MRATQRKPVIPLVFKRRTKRRHDARRYEGSVGAPRRREFDSNVEVVTEKRGREREVTYENFRSRVLRFRHFSRARSFGAFSSQVQRLVLSVKISRCSGESTERARSKRGRGLTSGDNGERLQCLARNQDRTCFGVDGGTCTTLLALFSPANAPRVAQSRAFSSCKTRSSA